MAASWWPRANDPQVTRSRWSEREVPRPPVIASKPFAAAFGVVIGSPSHPRRPKEAGVTKST